MSCPAGMPTRRPYSWRSPARRARQHDHALEVAVVRLLAGLNEPAVQQLRLKSLGLVGSAGVTRDTHRCHQLADAVGGRHDPPPLDRLRVQAQERREGLDIPAVDGLARGSQRTARRPRRQGMLANRARCPHVEQTPRLSPVGAPRALVAPARLDEGHRHPEGRETPASRGRLHCARGVVRAPGQFHIGEARAVAEVTRQRANSRTGEPSRSSVSCGRPIAIVFYESPGRLHKSPDAGPPSWEFSWPSIFGLRHFRDEIHDGRANGNVERIQSGTRHVGLRWRPRRDRAYRKSVQNAALAPFANHVQLVLIIYK